MYNILHPYMYMYIVLCLLYVQCTAPIQIKILFTYYKIKSDSKSFSQTDKAVLSLAHFRDFEDNSNLKTTLLKCLWICYHSDFFSLTISLASIYGLAVA